MRCFAKRNKAPKPLHIKDFKAFKLVDVNGLEPLTLRTSSECSTS